MSIFTTKLIKQASKYIGCTETSNNRSSCVDEIQRQFNGKVNSESWCAKFVWSQVNIVCQELKLVNPLAQTASTLAMLSNAKKTPKLEVDNIPSVGSIFFTPRDGGGHVGFVLKVTGNKFSTIEGNATSGGKDGVYILTKDITKKNYQFIHIEKYHNLGDILQNNFIKIALVSGAIGAGFWYLSKI